MEHIDLTKCRGTYKCTIIELKRKKGGEYYMAELEFPNDKKITIDMQLIEVLYHKLHKVMSKEKMSEEPELKLVEFIDDMIMEGFTSPFVRDEILKQII